MTRSVSLVREEVHRCYINCRELSMYVTIDRNSGNNLEGLSDVTFFYKFRVNTPGNSTVLFETPHDSNNSWIQLINTTGTNLIARASTSSGNYVTSAIPYLTGEIMTIGIRVTGGHLELWKNGVKLESVVIAGTFNAPATNSPYFLNHSHLTNGVLMDIMFFRMWNYALSDSQMQNQNGWEDNSTINLKFQEGTGSTTKDYGTSQSIVPSLGHAQWIYWQSRPLI